ncbi:DEAD/DEAH box helicase [Acidovorax sp. SRB_24]|uniref:DEAD/DEAH box helicase n=1 Tax=Acidovorax sp. SRB_24 TaxID=1962700 RepID=UPI00145C7F98|nr:DEAD/DEAH box helicase [Acidovorax sp. SRB_24]NMM76219.1 hypothetical protein [Acidovorax sp. SRB_24]
MKALYAVSASVGSGKTKAAVEYLARPETSTQDFIYVAPTIRLLNQTEGQLRSLLETQEAIRNVHLIHSEARDGESGSAATEALQVINARPAGLGRVVFLTTKTFLRIVSQIGDPTRWALILDEAFAPVTFISYHLGPRPEEGLDYFREMFRIDTQDNHRVVPVTGRDGLVTDIASGNLDQCGQKYLGQSALAQEVSNPAMRCELVVTPTTRIVSDLFAETAEADPAVKLTCSELLFASYLTPEYFGDFREVILLSALFEHTVLYHLWTRSFGVRFVPHPWFDSGRLRDVHVEQGPMIAVGHLLHQEDRASKHNLLANRHTGAPGERMKGARVVDGLVQTAAEFFKGSQFLLQTNNGAGYGPGGASVPDNAQAIPVVSHGLNDFMDSDNVVALAVTNPNPQQLEWVQTRTGLTKDEVLRAHRIHTVYQAIGRTSVRSLERATARKVFLVAGYDDAKLLHRLFRGSRWLGQVGDQPSLRAVREAKAEPGVIRKMTDTIISYLDALPSDVTAIPSRSVKTQVAPELSSSTWTEASSRVSAASVTWRKDGHNFRQVLFTDHFKALSGHEQCAETTTMYQ